MNERTPITISRPLPHDLEASVMTLVNNGGKLDAVKLVMDSTGLNLQQSRDVVILISEGKSFNEIFAPYETFSIKEPTDEDMTEVVDLLRKGSKIMAFMKYRQATGLGIAEAKVAIDRIEAELSLGGK
jgi:ribosomal protein L7/L12